MQGAEELKAAKSPYGALVTGLHLPTPSSWQFVGLKRLKNPDWVSSLVHLMPPPCQAPSGGRRGWGWVKSSESL